MVSRSKEYGEWFWSFLSGGVVGQFPIGWMCVVGFGSLK